VIGAALIGVLGGMVAGLLGVGGGILFVPALVILLNQGQVDAEATSLLAIVPVALVGAWRQYHYGNVRIRDGLILGVLSAAGAVGGVAVANAVAERTLKVGFAIFTLVVAAQLVRRALRQPSSDSSAAVTGSER
jgi:uncharacterized membrane protein YfcA